MTSNYSTRENGISKPLFLYILLSVCLFFSCRQHPESVSHHSAGCDTAAIIDAYLAAHKSHSTEYYGKQPPQHTNEGTLIPFDQAKGQINYFVEHARYDELRSIYIGKDVFRHYMESHEEIEYFKICLSHPQRTDSTYDNKVVRIVVLAVNDKGQYVTLAKPGTTGAFVYDLLRPCPVDCPPAIADGEAHCDFIGLPDKCCIRDRETAKKSTLCY